MNKEIEIRKLCIADFEKVRQMEEQLHELHVLNRPDIYKPAETIMTKENFAELVTNFFCIGFGAQSQEEPAGYVIAKIKITPDDPLLVKHKTMYIDELFVSEEQRGKHIGKKLFQTLESEAKKLEIERIDLTVWSFNEGALNFYRSCGLDPQRIVLEKKL